MDEDARNPKKIGSNKENDTIFPSNLTLSGREFHSVGTGTNEARFPTFIFTRNTERAITD